MKQNVVGSVCLSLSVLMSWPGAASADDILTWNANAGKAAIAACLSPEGNALAEARMYAMAHAAMHDALNAIERKSRPYVFDTQVTAATSSPAAIATAARDVLVSVIMQLQESAACIQNGVASVEADYTAALAAIPNGVEKSRGVVLGQAAAAAVISLRALDGSDTPLVDPAYPQGTEPGEYRFTPGTPFAFAPGWGDVTPFVLNSSSQFRARPPYKVDSKEVRQGLQRGEIAGRRRHPLERSNAGADGNRILLGRELTACLEPPGSRRLGSASSHAS